MGSKGTDLAGTEDGIDSCPWMLADLCSFLLSASAAFSLAALSLPRSQARNLIFSSSQSVHLLGMAAWRKTGSALSTSFLCPFLSFFRFQIVRERTEWPILSHGPLPGECVGVWKGRDCVVPLPFSSYNLMGGGERCSPSLLPSLRPLNLCPSLPTSPSLSPSPSPPHRVTHTGICKIYNQE